MAWTYHDYEEQATDALRLARLSQHITEVNAKIAASVSDGGASRDTSNLTNYAATILYPRRKELQASARGASGAVGYIRRR